MREIIINNHPVSDQSVNEFTVVMPKAEKKKKVVPMIFIVLEIITKRPKSWLCS